MSYFSLGGSFFQKMAFKTGSLILGSGATPFGVARKSGRFLGTYFLKRFARRRFEQELEEEETEAMAEYLAQIIMRRGSSEYAFPKMFPNFNFSEHAIQNHLEDYKELGIEISFYFGEYDWMNT